MGHALNNTIQDVLIRVAPHGRATRRLWICGTDHAGIATQAVVEKAPRSRGHLPARSSGARSSSRRVWEWKEEYGGRIIDQLKRLGCTLDYARERFTMDEGYVAGGARGLRQPLREGLHLPRPLPGQLGPGAALGDLRPRGARTARSPTRWCASPTRSPTARASCVVATDAPRDHARRHRRGRPPRGRPLPAPDRQAPSTLPLVGPRDPGHRRRARRPRVRHRRAEGHARRTTPTTSRSPAATTCPWST